MKGFSFPAYMDEIENGVFFVEQVLTAKKLPRSAIVKASLVSEEAFSCLIECCDNARQSVTVSVSAFMGRITFYFRCAGAHGFEAAAIENKLDLSGYIDSQIGQGLECRYNIFKSYAEQSIRASYDKGINTVVLTVNTALAPALPIAVYELMFVLVCASDTLMLGKLSQSSMSAISLALRFSFIFDLFPATLAAAGGIIAAQYWGINDKRRLEYLFAMMLRFIIPISMVFAALSAAVPGALMRLLTDDPELIALGAEYMRSISPMFILSGIIQIYTCVMQSVGQAGRVSLISSLSTVLNITLNAVFIFGMFGLPSLGIRGAAYASVITLLIEYLAIKVSMRHKGSIRPCLRSLLHRDKDLVRKLRQQSMLILGQSVVLTAADSVPLAMLGHLSVDMVAANAVISILFQAFTCFCTGIATGYRIAVGSELGTNRLSDAKLLANQALTALLKCSIALAIVSVLAIPLILSATNLSPLAEWYLIRITAIRAVCMIGGAFRHATSGCALLAGGDMRFVFWNDTIMIGLGLLLAYLAGFVLKLPVLTVYCAACLFNISAVPALLIRYKKYKWLQNLTKSATTSSAMKPR